MELNSKTVFLIQDYNFCFVIKSLLLRFNTKILVGTFLDPITRIKKSKYPQHGLFLPHHHYVISHCLFVLSLDFCFAIKQKQIINVKVIQVLCKV